MTRLLLAAPPFAGHLNPLLTLGTGLRERGYDVAVATGVTKVELVRSLGFEAVPLLADDPGVFERIADTTGPVRSNPILLTRQLAANLALLPRARAELEAAFERLHPEAVLADFTAPVAGMVAQRHAVPWITTMPTPFALETRRGTPSYLGGWGPPSRPWHHWRDAAGRRATRIGKRGMQLTLRGAFERAGASVYRPDGSEAAYSPTAILGLGMSELELPRDWPSAFRMIGPVTGSVELGGGGKGGAAPELPAEPFVLVTLGTHLHWAKRGLVAQVRALAGRLPGTRFVVTLGDASRASSLPREVAGDVVVFDHLPYDAVMDRCLAVVHHGGAGITYSAVRAGVPALVCPRDYDQFDFAARIEAAGAGLWLRGRGGGRGGLRGPSLASPSLASAAAAGRLRAVLALDRAPLRELAEAARRYDPVAATAEVVAASL